ncbi:hypothetical protein [Vibrio parahaemolyticus]|uniref:hypothetical protein n=1 Tax=Vibrio parahaemolyticus TaxID=670 RepID=UPI00215D471B|nr:hypothetical protein [Vibrio parahaemolyticus]MCR9802014.1 hypothetical protein [Vibrio parahaemolyticus]
MKKLLILGVASLLLTACSAPKPPAISGKKEDVNLVKPKPVSDEIKLLNQIHTQLIRNQQTMLELGTQEPSEPSQTFVIHYPFNQTTATLHQIKPALVAAKSACKVELRARTDGAIPTTGDKAVAKKRATKLRDQLVRYGIQPQAININYAASTDYVDNNWTTQGQANNRRVEIDIYDTCTEE